MTDEEIIKLRRKVARMRSDRDRAEDLIKIMAARLAKQAREIAELRQKLYDVTALD